MFVVMVVVMIMPVLVLVIMMVVVVVMIVVVAAEEVRLDIEDAIKVEGVAAEHLIECDLGSFGFVYFGVRVDAADACFNLLQFFRCDKVGLVDKDYVRKSDLVFCFW